MPVRTTYSSPLGTLLLSSNGRELTGLRFAGEEKEQIPQLDIFRDTFQWLDLYFSGREPHFLPKLKLEEGATPFRRAVWQILLTIPYGQTTTYGAIAKKLAEERRMKKISAQAVGGAVAHNPIAILVPCHRVIGKDGSLTGYAGGMDRKRSLLQIEKTGLLSIEKQSLSCIENRDGHA